MSLRDWWKGLGHADAATRDSSGDVITAYDERGREVRIDRAVWVKDILLPNIEKAWNDAEQLYQQITQALRDEFTDSIVPAVNHLVELDGGSERSLLVQAMVRSKLGDLNGAEAALELSLKRHGRSGRLLVTLAELEERRGQRERSRATLRQALDMDPNQDHALLWWAALARERGGDEAYRAALAEIGAVQDAWRPKLWIARERLRNGDVTGALELYEQVLARAAEEPGVMTMIASDLSGAGALTELVELALPRYEARRDGPEAGIFIAEALKRLGRIERARALVRELQSLNFAPLAERLAVLDHELAAAGLPQRHESAPEIAALSLRAPLWTRGLCDPEWLWEARSASAPRVAFVPLADSAQEGPNSESRIVDDAGRASRALPFYLAETLHARFELETSCLVFVAKGHGPVLFGGDVKPQQFAHYIPEAGTKRLLVTGSVRPGGVTLAVWDVDAQATLARIDCEASLQELGTIASTLESKLCGLLESQGLLVSAELPRYYRSPPAATRSAYLAALEQLLYQVLAANELVPPESLWNERGMFEAYLGLVEAFGAPPSNAELFALSAVTSAAQYGSPVLSPYQKIVLPWLDAAPEGSLLQRLAPAVFKRVNDQPRLDAWFSRYGSGGDPAYAAWLESLRAS